MSVIIVVMMTIVLIPGKSCSRGWGELRTAWLCLYASGFTANITLHPQFMTKVNLTNLTIRIKIMTKVNGQKLDLVEDSVASLRIHECGAGCNQR